MGTVEKFPLQPNSSLHISFAYVVWHDFSGYGCHSMSPKQEMTDSSFLFLDTGTGTQLARCLWVSWQFLGLLGVQKTLFFI